MKKIEILKEWLGLLIDRPYIPEKLKKAKGPFLLHISDTPEETYKYIIKLIKNLNPKYIVHTGDLVDNIKLEINPWKIEVYKKFLGRFIPQLEKFSRGGVYYAMGNHDEIEVVKEISKRGVVMVEGHIMIEGIQFYINHYHVEEQPITQYYLFGHNFTPKNYKNSQHTALNGIQGINIIDLATEEIYILPYPLGTNKFRQMERRPIGL